MRGLVLTVLLLTGCSTVVPKTSAPGPAPVSAEVTAQLKTAQGDARGTAVLRMTDGRMRLTVEAMGLTPGARAVHIHNIGKCDAPDFMSAGPHWNPTSKQHGRDNPMGAHHGDLPNLMIGAEGRGSLSIDVPGTMAELLDADGAAVMIHAQPDDYKTDPTGNAGGRIACGVLTAP
jgi:superoxide dismutase, Cu-Zn family